MIEYVLIGDGRTDRALLPVIRWAMRRAHPSGTFATPTFLSRNARPIAEAVAEAREYQPNILFVHRDAEREAREIRRQEVPHVRDVVPVIPVRIARRPGSSSTNEPSGSRRATRTARLRSTFRRVAVLRPCRIPRAN